MRDFVRARESDRLREAARERVTVRQKGECEREEWVEASQLERVRVFDFAN